MDPSLSFREDRYKVALVGEALGEKELAIGLPFQGPAGFRLSRLLEWGGLEREKFDIWNAVWCKPPNNELEGKPYEFSAIDHCRSQHWEKLLSRVEVVVPMGNVPLHALTGRKGILKSRGYIQDGAGFRVVPTVHPSFIQRGQSKYSAAFIHDVQKAVELAQGGMVFEHKSYSLDPLPGEALEWAKEAVAYALHNDSPIAFDIETPGKDEDEGEVDTDEDKSYFIWRIGFSHRPLYALSIPWTAPYFPAIKLIMESMTQKVVWNADFDVPRIRYNGVEVNGLVHDGMVAWHILHSDLPKGLGFVATFTCPFQPMWKHLSHASPAYYNATDADVELRSFLVIEDELKKAGLWKVYQGDVLDLDPILQHMKKEGMPLNHSTRLDRAQRLAEKQASVLGVMEGVVPVEARKVEHVYVNTPSNTNGLRSRKGTRVVPCCDRCGAEKPRKPHFTIFKKKVNPCGGGNVVGVEKQVDEYYRLQEFTPSRNQIIRYNELLKRQTPTTWDKKTKSRKVTTNEKAIKQLMGKYPDDKFYPLVLEYRELDKIAGTYIGRFNEGHV